MILLCEMAKQSAVKRNSKTEAQPVILSQSCGKDNKYLFLFGIIS